MKAFLLIAALYPLSSLADGVPVSPDTPSVVVPEKVAPKFAKVPSECVSRVLDVIFNAEKEFFAAKKTYSTSYLEMHAASKVGVGCPGWTLPSVELFYGGTGYKATMTDDATGLKWILNQDHWLHSEGEPRLKVEVPAGKH